LLWIASYAVWAITPKSIGFFYYYYLPSIFLCVALAAAFDRYARGRLEHWDEAFVILAFGLAVYFFPIVSAAPLSGEQAFENWMWFSTWP
jgi:dolichyl-phosphate-mannose-protein mannosyltransferase